MKMIAGAAALACWNRSRTREAPTPTIISTNSEADIWKNGTPASPATARASSVLPVPGAPLSSTPRGIRPPSLRYLSGFFRKSTISVSSSLASSIPATSENVTCCSSASTRRARERPNDIRPPAPPPPAARRIRKMNSPTSRIVGPNPKIRLVKNDGPESGDLASIVTLWSCSRFDSAVLSANDGTWVEKLTVALAFLIAGRVGDRLAELALDRVPGGGDLLDVVVPDLGQERRAVRDPDAGVGLERLRGDPQVQAEQHDHQPDDPPAGRSPRALGRIRLLSAAVRGGRHLPARQRRARGVWSFPLRCVALSRLVAHITDCGKRA